MNPTPDNTTSEPTLQTLREAPKATAGTEQDIGQVNFAFAKRHGVLIKELTDTTAIIVHRPRPNKEALMELRRILNRALKLQPVSIEQFERLLAQTYETDTNTAMAMAEDIGDDMDLSQLIAELPQAEDLLDTQDDAPIIRLLNVLFTEAIKKTASDIHVETFEDRLLIRFRIDGILREMLEPQRVLAPLVTSRIKVMAKLDIAEKRLPQDGRIALKIGGRAVDVRVSTMPTTHGERVVLRLLDKQAARLDIAKLGMEDDDSETMRKLISFPHGIILVTGPTGSGKTTTLYAVLTELNEATRNILTVEDPIEYHLPGIGQTQVNPKVNMTFARGLRAILRQDPDIVMIGEIRDLETAQIAVQASLTGHLVLSTLHTNSAIGAITRLIDMGVEPFLISSSLIGVIAQRLVRILCNNCKRAAPATVSECRILKVDPTNPPTIYHPVGCDECNNLGYRGRSGIYEIIPVDEKLTTMIHENEPQQFLLAHARTFANSMRDDGCRKVLRGFTTLEEVLRVSSEV